MSSDGGNGSFLPRALSPIPRFTSFTVSGGSQLMLIASSKYGGGAKRVQQSFGAPGYRIRYMKFSILLFC